MIWVPVNYTVSTAHTENSKASSFQTVVRRWKSGISKAMYIPPLHRGISCSTNMSLEMLQRIVFSAILQSFRHIHTHTIFESRNAPKIKHLVLGGWWDTLCENNAVWMHTMLWMWSCGRNLPASSPSSPSSTSSGQTSGESCALTSSIKILSVSVVCEENNAPLQTCSH